MNIQELADQDQAAWEEATRPLYDEIERLRAALKPFSQGADTCEKTYAGKSPSDDLMVGYWPMTLGDLRRARAVLQS